MTEKEEEVSIIILLQHEGRGPQHAMCTSTLHSIIQNIIIHTIIKHDDSAADQSQPKLSNWLIGQGLSLSSASIDQTGKE